MSLACVRARAKLRPARSRAGTFSRGVAALVDVDFLAV
jgi:hypothetical protein